jgi:hypothetical protein
MKTKKQIKKRNRRIIAGVILAIIMILLIVNMQEIIDGAREGAEAASRNF